MNNAKIIFIIMLCIFGLIAAYALSGAMVLILNKVDFFKFFELYHFNFIYEALSNSYPKTYQGLVLSFFISFLGVLLFSLLLIFKNKESLFGEARFANTREIKKLGLFGDKNNYVKKKFLRKNVCVACLGVFLQLRLKILTDGR